MRTCRLLKVTVFNLHVAGFLAAAALLLNGCVNQPAVPEDYFYRLPELQPGKPRDSTLFNGLLLVDEFQAEGVYRERPILYVDSKRPLEVLQYHYRHWIQTPSQLIQDNLVEYLRGANIATRVERYSSGKSGEMLIGGRLQKFEQRVQSNGATAVVAIEIVFRRKTPQGTIKQIRNYEDKVMAEGPTMHDSVVAFGKAMQHIYDRMLADLNAMTTE